MGKFPTRFKLFVREILTIYFTSVRHRYASNLSYNDYFMFDFNFFHLPPQQQGFFEPLLHTHGKSIEPACVDGPTHGGPYLMPRVHAGIGENTLHVDRKINFLSIFSLWDGQLMKKPCVSWQVEHYCS